MLQPADRYQAFQCHYGQYSAPSSRNTLSIGWMCMKTDKIRKKKQILDESIHAYACRSAA